MKKFISMTLCALILITALSLVACNNQEPALKFGMGLYVANAETTSASEEADGKGSVAITAAVITVDADGKVVASSSDCVQVKFTFDDKGASTFDTKKAVISKKDAGADYNMKAYGGAAKEWYEQAAAFDAACAGKTVTEIKALMVTDNKGNADLQSAGCTILVDGFIKAASKIG